jgi:hypothetical protein
LEFIAEDSPDRADEFLNRLKGFLAICFAAALRDRRIVSNA